VIELAFSCLFAPGALSEVDGVDISPTFQNVHDFASASVVFLQLRAHGWMSLLATKKISTPTCSKMLTAQVFFADLLGHDRSIKA
jgi:hypothetical protein